MQAEWKSFLQDIRNRDVVIYNAVNGFRFSKKDENTVLISYPSDSAKSEFEKIQGEFLNHFKRKVSNYQIQIEFKKDETLKQEIVTKRNVFEKFAEINPLLRELDDLMKFDFS